MKSWRIFMINPEISRTLLLPCNNRQGMICSGGNGGVKSPLTDLGAMRPVVCGRHWCGEALIINIHGDMALVCRLADIGSGSPTSGRRDVIIMKCQSWPCCRHFGVTRPVRNKCVYKVRTEDLRRNTDLLNAPRVGGGDVTRRVHCI